MNSAGTVLGRLAEPTADERTRVAFLSDLHLSNELSGTWRVSHRTEERLATAVESLNRTAVDAVVFNGDLVQSGTRAEYAVFDRLIEELDAPFYAIPGNHDLVSFGSGEKLTLPAFEDRYTPSALPYHERIGGIDLIALNSNQSTRESVADTYAGLLTSETLEWLDEKLTTVDNPLVAVHHNLPGTRALLEDASEWVSMDVGSPPFENATALGEVLERNEAPLVVTGHVHFPAFVRTRGVCEFTLPALGPYPGAYTVLDLDEYGTTIYLQSTLDRAERLEALTSGLDNSRVLLAAAQLAGLPLIDDCEPATDSQE